MEKKEEKTGLAFTDRVCEVAKELRALQQSAPADNKAALIIISTQHQNGDTMSNTIFLCGERSNLVHAIRTALGDEDLRQLFLAAMLSEIFNASVDSNEEKADE